MTEFAAPKAANMLGVGCGIDPEVVTVTFGKTFRGTPAVAATATAPAVPATPNNFADNDVHAWVYDLSGKQLADIAIPKGMGLNGFDAAGGQLYYGGNSGTPEIDLLNTKTKTATVWYDASLRRAASGAPRGSAHRHQRRPLHSGMGLLPWDQAGIQSGGPRDLPHRGWR